MKLKLIIALVTDDLTDKVTEVARREGATGATVITSARGEGLKPTKTMLGLTLEGQRDVCLFLVDALRSRRILEAIATECRFDEQPASGIAFQLDIEDAVGLMSQLKTIEEEIEGEI